MNFQGRKCTELFLILPIVKMIAPIEYKTITSNKITIALVDYKLHGFLIIVCNVVT